VKEDAIALVSYVMDDQSATDGGAKGQQLLADERAGMKDLAEQRDITAKRAQTLGQLSEVVTMRERPETRESLRDAGGSAERERVDYILFQSWSLEKVGR
jgi:hypothetical protein